MKLGLQNVNMDASQVGGALLMRTMLTAQNSVVVTTV